MDKVIPILSLVVAALAVFVGPVISWHVAKRQIASSLEQARQQIASSLEVSNKQIIAPMRQAWINSLRDLLAEITSAGLHYFVAGFEDRSDPEYQRLTFLEYKIKLMLNPREDDHQRLERLVENMVAALDKGKEGDADFRTSHTEVVALSREILKREWDRVRDPIPPP